jgi:hypothetical protein
MSKHTPGPFEIRIAGKDPKPCVFTAASPSEPLGRAVARFERIEDAQAFVALPDLLSALQAACDIIDLEAAIYSARAKVEHETANTRSAGDLKAKVNYFRAAIAKATGEP